MPQLGINEESAVITQWHVKQGAPVVPGQKLFSIETGKSSYDVEAQTEGILIAILAAEGDEVPVKTPVCYVGDPNETLEPAGTAEPTVPPGPAADSMTGVSPRARALAEKTGADPKLAVPTGPDGRVIERDIRASAEAADPSARQETRAYKDAPLSNFRKIIARNMMISLQNTAQLTHTASFDASAILCKPKGMTLTDIILYTASRVLKGFPALNAHLLGDTLRSFEEVHMAVAVDTERGLMVPVIESASEKTLGEISDELRTLAKQCRAGVIPPDKLSGGSFTLSNLGQFGIESFTPVLNAPQTGILGVCGILQRVRVTDGVLTAYPAMTLSLTYDHRALDGAPASRFLQALCKALEDFHV
jgi:pyruvate dehydrogenase E2 component (dihydrolipoamide acetyltransferase)